MPNERDDNTIVTSWLVETYCHSMPSSFHLEEKVCTTEGRRPCTRFFRPVPGPGHSNERLVECTNNGLVTSQYTCPRCPRVVLTRDITKWYTRQRRARRRYTKE